MSSRLPELNIYIYIYKYLYVTALGMYAFNSQKNLGALGKQSLSTKYVYAPTVIHKFYHIFFIVLGNQFRSFSLFHW